MIPRGPQLPFVACSECGACVPRKELDSHVCENERRLDVQIVRLRPQIARFEADLAAWLQTPQGAFERYYAATRRPETPSRFRACADSPLRAGEAGDSSVHPAAHAPGGSRGPKRDTETSRRRRQLETEATMEPTITPELEPDAHEGEDALVHEWRVDQLWRLGIPRLLAAEFAGGIDWHHVADLVERGCPALLALEIAR